MKKRISFVLFLMMAAVLVACSPQAGEPEVIEVTRVVTETEVVTETVVETRVVTETEIVTETVVETEEVVVEVLANRGHMNFADDYSFGIATTLDPHDPNRFFQTTVMMFNTLVERDVDGSLLPSLATSWTPNEDASEWTIALREGVLFHDGSEMTGNDVAYSLLRVTDPAVNSPLLAAWSIIQDVEVTGDYEVVVKLDPPNVDLPLLLTSYQGAVMREGGGDTIAEDGIGTGPFALESLDAAGITELVAFDQYWDGPPNAGSVSVIAISDNEARTQAMLAGQIDWLGITADQVPLFDNNNDFILQNIPSGGWSGMVMRTDTPPYDDPRVRKALRMVADRDEIIANTLSGFGTASCDHPVWTGDIYRNTDIDCSQDIEGAMALLAEAGYPDGIDVDVWTSALNAEWTAFLETYQSQAAEAGIRINIIQAPSDGYWSETWMTVPIAMTAWGERSAAQILPEAYKSGVSWNETYYNNEEFDSLLDEASQTVDEAARIEIYQQLQEILWEDGGSFIPYHINAQRVVSTCVGGFEPISTFFIKYEKLVRSPDC